MSRSKSQSGISENSPVDSAAFASRLKEAFAGESTNAFAKKCGVGESSLRSYLSGSFPSIDRAALIAQAADVSLEWLITGKGEMSLTEGSGELEREFALIPGYNIQVAAGNGIVPENEHATRKLAFRHKWLKYRGLKEKDLVLVFARGDSMEPVISDNNTLMIDTSKQVLEDGSIYVIRNNEHLVVKRIQNTLKGFILISDNKEYERVEVSYNEADDLQVIGKVVWIGKDL